MTEPIVPIARLQAEATAAAAQELLSEMVDLVAEERGAFLEEDYS